MTNETPSERHGGGRVTTVFSLDTERFVAGLDDAIEAHLGWTRRVLRCAVLHTSPGDDVLAPDAHCRCRFGRWLAQNLASVEQVDAAASLRVTEHHRRMHDGVRSLCTDLLATGRGEPHDLDAFEAMQSALVADLAYLKTEMLSRSARRDALTGLPLRYGLEEEFARCQATAGRAGQLLVVLLVDVDHFKHVNDTHGHAVGDRALCHVAAVLRVQARLGEPVFRFGGEEFLVLLHATDLVYAEVAAERLLQALRDAPMVLPGGGLLPLRMSAGLAAAGPQDQMAQVIDRADRALFAAKAAGRDRWCWAAR